MTCCLLFTDLDGAYKGLLNAVRSGEIPEKRIDESVLKILRVKASVGLNKASQVDINELSSVISSPETWLSRSKLPTPRSPWSATMAECCRSGRSAPRLQLRLWSRAKRRK